MNTKIFWPAFFVLILSCRNSALDRINKHLSIYNSNTFISDIPVRFKEPGVVKKLKQDRERTLGLMSLENGSSNFQIRIWDESENNLGRVIVINNINKKWSAEIYKYRYVSTGTFFRDSVSGEKFPLNSPKSGWNPFLNKLLDYEIMTIPDFSKITDYNLEADEYGVTVEISKKNFYRIYEQTAPYIRQKQYQYSKQIVSILETINKEFNL